MNQSDNEINSSAASMSTHSVSWHWEGNTIVTEEPLRPEGQSHVVGLRCEPIPTVRIAFIGLGKRGADSVKLFTHIKGAKIVALCDNVSACVDVCQEFVAQAGLPRATEYTGEDGYKEACSREDVDLVYISTDWDHHFSVAKFAMEHGKHVAIEVPAVMNVAQCWELVNLSESLRLHCMILENCCYDWFELNTLSMVQNGVFGEIIRAQGAYLHNLYQYWKGGLNDKLGWRLRYNMENRGDVYATHGLGPIAQVLNIHRGDRMETLVAMDTKSVIGRGIVQDTSEGDCNEFRNGDHTSTLIRTAKGKMIEIQHNVMTPQPYSRIYELTGTRGYAIKHPMQGYALDNDKLAEVGIASKNEGMNNYSFLSNSDMDALTQKYQHPFVKQYGEVAKQVDSHGGKDYMMNSRLVYCLQNGLPLDMDVYDLAEWCCLAELGSLSMDHGCAPVRFPDFTRGNWNVLDSYCSAE